MPEYQHFFLRNTSKTAAYTATGGGSGRFRSPPRDRREAHGSALIEQFSSAVAEAAARQEAHEPNTQGIQFLTLSLVGVVGKNEDRKDFSGVDLDKLSSDAKGIRVVNVREDGDRQIATIAVPDAHVLYFQKKFTDYIEPKKDRISTTKDGQTVSKPANQKLVESISELRLSQLGDYYTDTDESPPGQDDIIWWEVWLERLDGDAGLNRFTEAASQHGIELL